MEISPALKKRIDEIPALHEALWIEFADSSRLADMQLGYAMDVMGKDLSGTGKGEWRSEWLVFGYDYGDPVFVDRQEEAKDFPVYVADHGTGSWEPQEIAVSLSGFIQILIALNAGMVKGDMDYKKLMQTITPYTKNRDYWEVVIEGIEEELD